ncbi:MAG: hypothetical protein IPG51_20755 [Chloroflexi bacterium]|nr:hypothetical protein [Chloroflexota bacterium]
MRVATAVTQIVQLSHTVWRRSFRESGELLEFLERWTAVPPPEEPLMGK